jgi:hypothetical protein
MQGTQQQLTTTTSTHTAKSTPVTTPRQRHYDSTRGEELWDSLEDEKKVEELLEKDVDPNHIHRGLRWDGWSCLAWATYERQIKIVRLLLGAKANPNSKAPDGYPSLLELAASREPNSDIKRCLSHAGAVPDQKSSMLKDAMEKGDWESKDLVISLLKNITDDEKNEMLIYIITTQNTTYIFKSYHVEKTILNIPRRSLRIPYASQYVETLLENGANPNLIYGDMPIVVYAVQDYCLALQDVRFERLKLEAGGYEGVMDDGAFADDGDYVAKERLCADFKFIVIALIKNGRFNKSILTQTYSELKNNTPSSYIQENCPSLLGYLRDVPELFQLSSAVSSSTELPLLSVEEQKRLDVHLKKLTVAIFNALFIGVTQGNNELSTAENLLRLVFNSPSSLITLAARIELDKAQLKSVKTEDLSPAKHAPKGANEKAAVQAIDLPEEGRRFVVFTKHWLLRKRAEQEGKMLYEADSLDRKRWYSDLTEKQKQQEQFSHQMREAADEFMRSPGNMSAWENIAHRVVMEEIKKLEAKKEEARKRGEKLSFQLPQPPARLQALIKTELRRESRLRMSFDSAKEQALVKSIADQFWYSLTDNAKIDSKEVVIIYRRRIQAAIDNWLYRQTGYDQDEGKAYELKSKDSDEEAAYKIASQIIAVLNNECKEMKGKKIDIARLLIKEILLTYPTRRDSILNYLRNNPGNIDDFVKYVNKQMQSDAMKHFSAASAAQESYRDRFSKVTSDWLTINKGRAMSHAEVSTSRAGNGDVDMEDDVADNQKEEMFTQKQRNFIDGFCAEFEKFYCMYQALNLKMVRRLEQLEDKAAAKSVDYRHVTLPISVMGSGVNFPIGEVGHFLANLAVWRADKSIENAARRLVWLFGGLTMEEAAKFMRMAAEYIAQRYRMQIAKLVTRSINTLALAAAHRAIQYVISSDEHLIEEKPPLFARIWQSVSNFFTDPEAFKPQLVNQLKDTLSVLVNGVMIGRSGVKDDEFEPMTTEDGRRWQSIGVFNNVGLVIMDDADQPCFYMKDPDVRRNPDGSAYHSYCYVTRDELKLAEKEGYKRDEISMKVALNLSPTAKQTAPSPAFALIGRQASSSPRGATGGVHGGVSRVDPAAVAAATAAAASAAPARLTQ